MSCFFRPTYLMLILISSATHKTFCIRNKAKLLLRDYGVFRVSALTSQRQEYKPKRIQLRCFGPPLAINTYFKFLMMLKLILITINFILWYIIYTQTQHQNKMENNCNQLQNPVQLLDLVCSLPHLSGYCLPFLFPNPFNNKTDFRESSSVFASKFLSETSFNKLYESRTKQNIVLNSKAAKMGKKSKVTKISDSEESTTKVPRKCIQKETRNINSNLLRIFLKNLIELRIYSDKIKLISTQIKAKFSTEQFYLWMQGFGINFKNYIRAKQVSKAIAHQQPSHFKKTFMILLQHFSQQIGLTHCLTSKRIERNSIKMHLTGLRSLSKDLHNVSQAKK